MGSGRTRRQSERRGGVVEAAGKETLEAVRLHSRGCLCPSSRARAMPASSSELPRVPPPTPAQERGAKSRPHGELQYLEQIEHILRCGFQKNDRTGTGTLSMFGLQARYSLRGDWGSTRGKGGRPPGGLGAAAEESARERLGPRLTFSPKTSIPRDWGSILIFTLRTLKPQLGLES